MGGQQLPRWVGSRDIGLKFRKTVLGVGPHMVINMKKNKAKIKIYFSIFHKKFLCIAYAISDPKCASCVSLLLKHRFHLSFPKPKVSTLIQTKNNSKHLYNANVFFSKTNHCKYISVQPAHQEGREILVPPRGRDWRGFFDSVFFKKNIHDIA